MKSILKSKTIYSHSGTHKLNMTSDVNVGVIKKRTHIHIINQIPGLIPEDNNDDTQPAEEVEIQVKTAFELEEEENERKAKEAFKTLAGILKQAKEEKYKLMKEEMAKGNLVATDINDLSAAPRISSYNMKKFRIYPEGKVSTLLDLFMTL